jgi:hypothetical protein
LQHDTSHRRFNVGSPPSKLQSNNKWSTIIQQPFTKVYIFDPFLGLSTNHPPIMPLAGAAPQLAMAAL